MNKPTDRIKAICTQFDQYKLELFQILIDKKNGIPICHKPLREYLFIIIQAHIPIRCFHHAETHHRLKGPIKSENKTKYQGIRQPLCCSESEKYYLTQRSLLLCLINDRSLGQLPKICLRS
jgi:hypothetical protein